MARVSFLVISIACIAIGSCNDNQPAPMEQADIIMDLSAVEIRNPESTKPAIITGHIRNRQVYPDVNNIRITIPTFGNVPIIITSPIWDDDSFSFQFFPFAMRQVSISPYIEEMIICPGDSINLEIDFANLLDVACSGNGADNNQKLSIFHNKYYLKNWSGLNPAHENSGQEAVKRMLDGFKQRRQEYRECLDHFIRNEKPSKELAEFCRKEIETDYYTFVQYLYTCEQMSGKVVSRMFDVKEVEPLLEDPCLNGNLYKIVSAINNWLQYCYYRDHKDESFEQHFLSYMEHIKKITGNGILRQMLVSDTFNEMIDRNDTESFERFYPYFTQAVSNPILKMSTRDRYLSRKSFKDNPRLLSDAILYPERGGDSKDVSFQINPGIMLIRDILERNERKVIYISIGAHWCRGCVEERPYLKALAEDMKGKPLKIVDLLISVIGFQDANNTNAIGNNIEDHLLTDEQYYGLEPIFKTGDNGIPYYILINKDGVIVDYGGHLRPSIPSTYQKIEKLLSQ